jgi:hypothetical protein
MGKSVVIQRIPEIKRVLELYNEGGPEEVVKSIQGISDWISSDLESSYSLDYLEKYEFKENPILNNLYATVLEYQEQKKSRDEKEEHQFLIAILIGRKIKAIAQLHDESVISSHLNHLKDFMGKICAEEFLTTAPVFKMVLLQFKGNLEGKTDIEKSHSSKFEALSKNIQDEVNKLLEVIKSELLALTSPFEYPENFFLVSDPENDLLQNVEAITKSPLYLSLKKLFIENKLPENVDLLGLFKETTGSGTDVGCFKNLMTRRYNLIRLLSSMDLEKLKTEISMLRQDRINFFYELCKIYPHAAKQFKDKLLRYRYKSLDEMINSIVKKIDEALLLQFAIPVAGRKSVVMLESEKRDGVEEKDVIDEFKKIVREEEIKEQIKEQLEKPRQLMEEMAKLKHIPEQYKFGLLIAVKNREDLNDVSEKFIVLLKEISLLKERFHKHKPEGINTAFFKRYNQISEFLESKFSVCLSCFVGELLSKPDKIEECFEAAKKQLEDSITAYIEPLEKEKVAAANPMPSKEQIGSMIY